MALQTLKGGIWIPVQEHVGQRLSDFQINASGEKYAVIFRVTNNTANVFPYCGLYTVSWTKYTRIPLLGIEYSDGSYEFNNCFAYTTNSATNVINTGTTPDEVGNYFSYPFPVAVG